MVADEGDGGFVVSVEQCLVWTGILRDLQRLSRHSLKRMDLRFQYVLARQGRFRATV